MNSVPFDPADRMNALLAEYSAGTLSPAMQALVDGHLELRRTNHSFVEALDSLQGEAMMQCPGSFLSDRDGVLASVFAAGKHQPSASSAKPRLPHALLKLVGHDLNAVKWHTMLPGIREYRISDQDRGEAVLYWIKAGRSLPSHTHDGSETTLVIKGAFRDVNGRYGRGDVAIADADIDHKPMTEAGEDCICFAVTDAPLRMTGRIGKVISALFGPKH